MRNSVAEFHDRAGRSHTFRTCVFVCVCVARVEKGVIRRRVIVSAVKVEKNAARGAEDDGELGRGRGFVRKSFLKTFVSVFRTRDRKDLWLTYRIYNAHCRRYRSI